MVYFQNIGLVLKIQDYKENSAIVHILTKDFGKLKFFIQGIKKPKSKLLGHFQTGSVVNFQAGVKGNKFKILTGLTIINFSEVWKQNPYNFLWTLSLLNFLPLIEQTEEIFKFVIKVLKRNYLTYPGYQVWFSLKILKLLGYQPNLYFCSKCDLPLNFAEEIFFEKGNLLCQNCFPNRTEKNKIFAKQIELARELLNSPTPFKAPEFLVLMIKDILKDIFQSKL